MSFPVKTVLSAAVALGLFGIGKSVKAGISLKKAKKTNQSASEIIEVAKKQLDAARKKCNNSLKSLGEEKIKILDGTIKNFITLFQQLKNVEILDSADIQEFNGICFDKQNFEQLQEMSGFATSVLTGVGKGALGGAITAFGAYSAAGLLASASTGTALSSLSGAAATNATLAFFGGGSLASGGLGIAGGTVALGGLVAGPALAIMGVIVDAKATIELNNAMENLSIARKTSNEMLLASDMCEAIAKRSDQFRMLLKKLDIRAAKLVSELNDSIKEHGADYTKFNLEQKKSLAACVSTIKAIKTVLDTPILTKDGKLTLESSKIVELMNKQFGYL